MNADSIRIETDEDGFWLEIQPESWTPFRFRIIDPEALYDHVKAAIGPWLYERDMAQRTRPFECDPEEDYFDEMRHSVRADLLADQT